MQKKILFTFYSSLLVSFFTAIRLLNYIILANGLIRVTGEVLPLLWLNPGEAQKMKSWHLLDNGKCCSQHCHWKYHDCNIGDLSFWLSCNKSKWRLYSNYLMKYLFITVFSMRQLCIVQQMLSCDVCPSICPSRVYCVKTTEVIIKQLALDCSVGTLVYGHHVCNIHFWGSPLLRC